MIYAPESTAVASDYTGDDAVVTATVTAVDTLDEDEETITGPAVHDGAAVGTQPDQLHRRSTSLAFTVEP